jgi:acyl-CoA synthetase (NDP forming)
MVVSTDTREEQLLEIVRGAGMRMVGPNSLGVLNTDATVSLNATFAGASVPSGRLGRRPPPPWPARR